MIENKHAPNAPVMEQLSNTVVPGYGAVFKVNGTFTADFAVWSPIYESTAWNITPFNADPEAFDVLCEYFS